MGITIKNTRSSDFYADQIAVITHFAIITNVVIMRVHCNYLHFCLVVFILSMMQHEHFLYNFADVNIVVCFLAFKGLNGCLLRVTTMWTCDFAMFPSTRADV